MEKGIYVTVEQIDAAWEMLEKYSKHAHWLEMLLRECFGICRCPECGGTGDVFLKPSEFYTTGGEESKKCPNCHGHGWVREERDDE
jgi:Zn finger protein HypA/HybF involved in hydrogenase expression